MDHIVLPSKITVEPGTKDHEARISIQPCNPGFGTTLGNALRRVLLSSLPGGAVTAFKIKGASHEFSAMKFVKEDLVEISLNLKQLRLKIETDEPVRIKLNASGEKVVKAKDITATSDVEVINKDLVICTLTSKEAEFEMELLVKKGLGYVPTEVREKDDLEVGMIPIDAIYTPMRNVGFEVNNVRVGQMTNYENLILTIETDGTITPQDALEKSARILIDHFEFIDQQLGSDPADESVETPVAEIVAAVEVEQEPAAEEDVVAKPKKRGRPKKEVQE